MARIKATANTTTTTKANALMTAHAHRNVGVLVRRFVLVRKVLMMMAQLQLLNTAVGPKLFEKN